MFVVTSYGTGCILRHFLLAFYCTGEVLTAHRHLRPVVGEYFDN